MGSTEDGEASQLLAAQERLNRKRQDRKAAQLESKKADCSQINSLHNQTEQIDTEIQTDSEDSERFRGIKKEESPSGDGITPSAAARDEIQNANAKDGGVHESQDAGVSESLLTVPVESELFTGGGRQLSGTVESKTPTLSTQLPLKRFVQEAATISIEQAEDASGDKWKSRTWEFTRLCKTHPKLMALTADEAYNAIPWHVTQFDEEEQMQFLVEWNAVQHLPGVPILEWAASLAKSHPLLSTRKQFRSYNQFISVAGWLQNISRDKNIFLPTRKIAEILGLKSHVQVATLCKLAVADGFLKVMEQHTEYRVTRYRFAVERYEILGERGNL
jgi:hypothetical protein